MRTRSFADETMTPKSIIERLHLKPHPEGGYYAETYRSAESVAGGHLPARYGGPRAFCTAIFYLLTAGDRSALHRVKSDELFHFYAGDPLEMLLLAPDGTGSTVLLGSDLAAGESPQILVPAGWWQGARLKGGGRFALVGCTVAPGFDFADFELGRRDDLLSRYPKHAARIAELTRP